MQELTRWKPYLKLTFEDRLLYTIRREIGSLIYTELVVGDGGPGNIWPKGFKPRHIDAARILS